MYLTSFVVSRHICFYSDSVVCCLSAAEVSLDTGGIGWLLKMPLKPVASDIVVNSYILRFDCIVTI